MNSNEDHVSSNEDHVSSRHIVLTCPSKSDLFPIRNMTYNKQTKCRCISHVKILSIHPKAQYLHKVINIQQ